MKTHLSRSAVPLLASLFLVVGCGDDGNGGGNGGGDGMPDTGMTDTDDMTGEDTSSPDTMPTEPDGSGGGGDTTEFQVRIENTSASDVYDDSPAAGGAIWITPGAYAVHTGDNPIFASGEETSSGLEAVAEAGRPGGTSENDSLVETLDGMDKVSNAGAWGPDNTTDDPNDPMGSVPGAPPIAPGGAFEFDIEASPGDKLSLATMYVPSNDIFLAPGSDGITLFSGGTAVDGDVTDQVQVWDAGTEPNQQPGFGSNSAPLQDNPDQGDDEGASVRSISDIEDGYNYASASDAVSVTVTPTGGSVDAGSVTFTVRIENTAPSDFYPTEATPPGGGIWITPGGYALHTGSSPVYTTGESASSGLEAVAEAGKPSGTPENESFVETLSGQDNVSNAGAWGPDTTVEDPNDPMGSVPGAPPIATGGAFEFTVEATPGDKLSFATMFVPSNDIFFAPTDGGIALFNDGEPVDSEVTDQIGLFDAGTEVNQKPGFGPLSAPLQGMGDDAPGADAGIDEEGPVRSIDEVEDGYKYPAVSDTISVTVSPTDN